MTATGVIGTATWTMSGLPDGLIYDSASGVISGVPTAWGSSTVNVTVRDSRDRSATQQFVIGITPTPIAILPTLLPNGQVDLMYGSTLTATGGSGSTSWSAQGNLAGLNVHGSGTVSGVPQSSGTFTFTVTASDTLFPDNI